MEYLHVLAYIDYKTIRSNDSINMIVIEELQLILFDFHIKNNSNEILNP